MGEIVDNDDFVLTSTTAPLNNKISKLQPQAQLLKKSTPVPVSAVALNISHTRNSRIISRGSTSKTVSGQGVTNNLKNVILTYNLETSSAPSTEGRVESEPSPTIAQPTNRNIINSRNNLFNSRGSTPKTVAGQVGTNKLKKDVLINNLESNTATSTEGIVESKTPPTIALQTNRPLNNSRNNLFTKSNLNHKTVTNFNKQIRINQNEITGATTGTTPPPHNPKSIGLELPIIGLQPQRVSITLKNDTHIKSEIGNSAGRGRNKSQGKPLPLQSVGNAVSKSNKTIPVPDLSQLKGNFRQIGFKIIKHKPNVSVNKNGESKKPSTPLHNSQITSSPQNNRNVVRKITPVISQVDEQLKENINELNKPATTAVKIPKPDLSKIGGNYRQIGFRIIKHGENKTKPLNNPKSPPANSGAGLYGATIPNPEKKSFLNQPENISHNDLDDKLAGLIPPNNPNTIFEEIKVPENVITLQKNNSFDLKNIEQPTSTKKSVGNLRIPGFSSGVIRRNGQIVDENLPSNTFHLNDSPGVISNEFVSPEILPARKQNLIGLKQLNPRQQVTTRSRTTTTTEQPTTPLQLYTTTKILQISSRGKQRGQNIRNRKTNASPSVIHNIPDNKNAVSNSFVNNMKPNVNTKKKQTSLGQEIRTPEDLEIFLDEDLDAATASLLAGIQPPRRIRNKKESSSTENYLQSNSQPFSPTNVLSDNLEWTPHPALLPTSVAEKPKPTIKVRSIASLIEETTPRSESAGTVGSFKTEQRKRETHTELGTTTTTTSITSQPRTTRKQTIPTTSTSRPVNRNRGNKKFQPSQYQNLSWLGKSYQLQTLNQINNQKENINENKQSKNHASSKVQSKNIDPTPSKLSIHDSKTKKIVSIQRPNKVKLNLPESKSEAPQLNSVLPETSHLEKNNVQNSSLKELSGTRRRARNNHVNVRVNPLSSPVELLKNNSLTIADTKLANEEDKKIFNLNESLLSDAGSRLINMSTSSDQNITAIFRNITIENYEETTELNAENNNFQMQDNSVPIEMTDSEDSVFITVQPLVSNLADAKVSKSENISFGRLSRGKKRVRINRRPVASIEPEVDRQQVVPLLRNEIVENSLSNTSSDATIALKLHSDDDTPIIHVTSPQSIYTKLKLAEVNTGTDASITSNSTVFITDQYQPSDNKQVDAQLQQRPISSRRKFVNVHKTISPIILKSENETLITTTENAPTPVVVSVPRKQIRRNKTHDSRIVTQTSNDNLEDMAKSGESLLEQRDKVKLFALDRNISNSGRFRLSSTTVQPATIKREISAPSFENVSVNEIKKSSNIKLYQTIVTPSPFEVTSLSETNNLGNHEQIKKTKSANDRHVNYLENDDIPTDNSTVQIIPSTRRTRIRSQLPDRRQLISIGLDNRTNVITTKRPKLDEIITKNIDNSLDDRNVTINVNNSSTLRIATRVKSTRKKISNHTSEIIASEPTHILKSVNNTKLSITPSSTQLSFISPTVSSTPSPTTLNQINNSSATILIPFADLFTTLPARQPIKPKPDRQLVSELQKVEADLEVDEIQSISESQNSRRTAVLRRLINDIRKDISDAPKSGNVIDQELAMSEPNFQTAVHMRNVTDQVLAKSDPNFQTAVHMRNGNDQELAKSDPNFQTAVHMRNGIAKEMSRNKRLIKRVKLTNAVQNASLTNALQTLRSGSLNSTIETKALNIPGLQPGIQLRVVGTSVHKSVSSSASTSKDKSVSSSAAKSKDKSTNEIDLTSSVRTNTLRQPTDFINVDNDLLESHGEESKLIKTKVIRRKIN